MSRTREIRSSSYERIASEVLWPVVVSGMLTGALASLMWTLTTHEIDRVALPVTIDMGLSETLEVAKWETHAVVAPDVAHSDVLRVVTQAPQKPTRVSKAGAKNKKDRTGVRTEAAVSPEFIQKTYWKARDRYLVALLSSEPRPRVQVAAVLTSDIPPMESRWVTIERAIEHPVLAEHVSPTPVLETAESRAPHATSDVPKVDTSGALEQFELTTLAPRRARTLEELEKEGLFAQNFETAPASTQMLATPTPEPKNPDVVRSFSVPVELADAIEPEPIATAPVAQATLESKVERPLEDRQVAEAVLRVKFGYSNLDSFDYPDFEVFAQGPSGLTGGGKWGFVRVPRALETLTYLTQTSGAEVMVFEKPVLEAASWLVGREGRSQNTGRDGWIHLLLGDGLELSAVNGDRFEGSYLEADRLVLAEEGPSSGVRSIIVRAVAGERASLEFSVFGQPRSFSVDVPVLEERVTSLDLRSIRSLSLSGVVMAADPKSVPAEGVAVQSGACSATTDSDGKFWCDVYEVGGLPTWLKLVPKGADFAFTTVAHGRTHYHLPSTRWIARWIQELGGVDPETGVFLAAVRSHANAREALFPVTSQISGVSSERVRGASETYALSRRNALEISDAAVDSRLPRAVAVNIHPGLHLFELQGRGGVAPFGFLFPIESKQIVYVDSQ